MNTERIELLVKEQGKSLTHLCNLLGKGRYYLRDVSRGKASLSRQFLEKIAADLGTTAEYLNFETDDSAPVSVTGVKIPILGEVAAGIPLSTQENIVDYEEIPREMAQKGEFFGLVVRGSSMEPQICNGDRVIVKHQDYCASGQVAIVIVANEAATCKKVVLHEDGLELVSYNPLFPAARYSAEAVEKLPITIMGVVARVIRDLI